MWQNATKVKIYPWKWWFVSRQRIFKAGTLHIKPTTGRLLTKCEEFQTMTENFTITKLMVITDKVVSQGFICCVVYHYQRHKGQKIFDIRDQRFSVDMVVFSLTFNPGRERATKRDVSRNTCPFNILMFLALWEFGKNRPSDSKWWTVFPATNYAMAGLRSCFRNDNTAASAMGKIPHRRKTRSPLSESIPRYGTYRS